MTLKIGIAGQRFLTLASVVALLGVANLLATPVTVAATGAFTSGVSTDILAVPDGVWTFSFAIDSTPLAVNPDALGFDAPFSNFIYTLNGSSVADAPAEIRFYATAGGGLFTLFFGPETGFNNGAPIPEFTFSGSQVFSGTTASPTLLAGNYPVSDAIYSDAANYDDQGASATVAASSGQPTSAVPEPATGSTVMIIALLLLAAGLCRRLPRRTELGSGAPLFTMLMLFCLMPGSARADLSKTIEVVPNVQVTSSGTWYYKNCTTSLGTGSYAVHVAPFHGTSPARSACGFP